MIKLVGQELYPKATYVHCAYHRLNLALGESLSVPSVTNELGVVKETKICSNITIKQQKARLLGLCETMFIEHHEAVNTFVVLLPAIVPSLQNLSQWNITFLMALFVSEYVSSLTLPLSSYLQIPQHDLPSAIHYCENILKMFQSLRASDNDDHKQFSEIFLKSILLPYVNGFVSLQQRFFQNKDILSVLEILLPKHAHENCVKELKKLSLYFEE
ncbi:hypothetical protein PR048_032034 [Dryococelus australis]|uniref:Uncharacterized protein n=1 Tax=Dryococelus australis TaxID=614101 RepID=A0ABQ9G6Y4_9NEOP|nr:hypothetical protein PR048_032034 [Dryococelus australis]